MGTMSNIITYDTNNNNKMGIMSNIKFKPINNDPQEIIKPNDENNNNKNNKPNPTNNNPPQMPRLDEEILCNNNNNVTNIIPKDNPGLNQEDNNFNNNKSQPTNNIPKENQHQKKKKINNDGKKIKPTIDELLAIKVPQKQQNDPKSQKQGSIY